MTRKPSWQELWRHCLQEAERHATWGSHLASGTHGLSSDASSSQAAAGPEVRDASQTKVSDAIGDRQRRESIYRTLMRLIERCETDPTIRARLTEIQNEQHESEVA